MIIYHADCTGVETNCLYPNRVDVVDAGSLASVVSHDYVCAEYKNSYRSNDNFITSNCLAVEFDNDHSDNPEDWVKPEDLVKAFPDVALGIHYSRNHMKEKKGRKPRPKFHAFMEIKPQTDAAAYAAMKQKVAAVVPHADPKAMDSAHFFYGTANPQVEFYPGTKTLDEVLEIVVTAENDFDAAMPQGTYGQQIITEGRRNAHMSRFAGRVLKRYGITEEAYKAFCAEAEKCDPPLDDEELSKVWTSAVRFANKLQKQAGYIPPNVYNAGPLLKPDDYSDIGQAKVIARDCASELAFSTGTDFIVYDNTRWVESKPRAVGCAVAFLDRQLEDAKAYLRLCKEKLVRAGVPEGTVSAGGRNLEKTVMDGNNPVQIAILMEYLSAITYLSFVMKRRDYKYISAALSTVKPMVEVDTRDLDLAENYLNCPDGTYDMATGIRKDHDPADLITKITPFSPGEEGKELWKDTLRLVFQGDAELIEYVQRIVGLGVIGEVYQESLIISFGQGSNGKSTFWNAIAGALGTYAGMISADVLTVGCRRNVKPEIAEIKGKRLLIAAELEEGQRLSTSIVKQLCSTDEIEGEKKYKDPFKFRPTHTLILYTNHLPKVGAMDDGIWRRLIVIPFNAKISGNSDTKNYSKYLLEHAGPYITKWIMEGAKKVIADHYKLSLPKCVSDAIEAYKKENDWMTHFLDECCEIGTGFEEKSGELYSSYRAYCARSGEYTRNTTDFYGTLELRGFNRQRRAGGRFITGLRLREEEGGF